MDAPRYILDKPIPEDIQRFLQRPLQPERPCVDLDDKMPHNVAYPINDDWVPKWFFPHGEQKEE